MMKRIEIAMEIWDNDISTEDKQHILLYCEHALRKTWNLYNNPPAPIKITERWWGGWTAEIEYSPYVEMRALLRHYNDKLCRLHYWNRHDEPLVMYWDWD